MGVNHFRTPRKKPRFRPARANRKSETGRFGHSRSFAAGKISVSDLLAAFFEAAFIYGSQFIRAELS